MLADVALESLTSLRKGTNLVVGFDVNDTTHNLAHHGIDVAQIAPILVVLFDQVRRPGARDTATRSPGALGPLCG